MFDTCADEAAFREWEEKYLDSGDTLGSTWSDDVREAFLSGVVFGAKAERESVLKKVEELNTLRRIDEKYGEPDFDYDEEFEKLKQGEEI